MREAIKLPEQIPVKVNSNVHYYESEVDNTLRLSDGIRMFKWYHPNAFDIKGSFTQKENGQIVLVITYKE